MKVGHILLFVNGFFFVFSLVWLIGQATTMKWNWEFWFALGYTLLIAVNFYYVQKRET
ncbi:MAG: hypothetical protein NXI20_07965 [bacterium]|nr:hypothetical protein [bacterium]